MVRQRALDPRFVGSNPTASAIEENKMNDYKLEEKIKDLEGYYNYDNKYISEETIKDIISYIHFLEDKIEELQRQMPY